MSTNNTTIRNTNDSQLVAERAPVWFIAHGGPPNMFDVKHPAYKRWQDIGRDMRRLHREGKLKGLVCISAHWEAQDLQDGVYVNVDEANPMIYDFYGFPEHYYKLKVQTNNPNYLSQAVITHLKSKGVNVVPQRRGVDHGLWAPFKVAFALPYPESAKEEENSIESTKSSIDAALPDGLPLVQLSLPRSEDSIDSLRLGRALRGLREQGYGIVGSGHVIHNLPDLFKRMRLGLTDLLEYEVGFGTAVTETLVATKVSADAENGNGDELSAPPEERWNQALQLEKNQYFRQAHPRPDHFLPLLVTLGASYSSETTHLAFNHDQGAWSMFEWGLASDNRVAV